ncbi:MAG: glycosyltransferase family 4 protein [bacterium]
MILDKEFPIDERVEKEAIALKNTGHNIYILSLRYSKKKPIFQRYIGINIIRKDLKKVLVKLFRPLLLTFLDLYTPFWENYLKRSMQKYEFDVIHVHDLYLLGTAIKIKKKFYQDIKIVADLHENYPYAIKNYTWSNSWYFKFLIPFKKWIDKEKEWTQKADKIITVVEEMKDRISVFNNSDKIYVVPNYIEKNMIYRNYTIDQEIIRKIKDNFVVSYIGGIDVHKGVEILIKSMVYVENNIKLVVVGKGKNHNELVKIVWNNNLQNRVFLEGWKHHDLLPNYYNYTDVFCIPHLKSVQTDNSSPGKLFRYMAAGKPIVASNCNSIVRVIQDAKCGLIFQSGDEKELSEKINYLYNNKSVCKEFGNNSLISSNEKYNWEKAKRALLKLYKNENIVKSKK